MTKAESRWIRIIKEEIGCICCLKLGHGYTPADAHHLLSGGRRRNGTAIIPLCPYHHRGIRELVDDKLLGPSLAHGSKPFHAVFGTDEHLLERTRELVAEYESNTVGKVA